jgi:RimJ/RimL family protein N-acetyltransferase
VGDAAFYSGHVTNESPPSVLATQLAHYLPLFALRVTTPRLSLRLPTDPELLLLLKVIEGGVHDQAEMPFLNAWTDVASPQRERESLAHWWRLRAQWAPSSWKWSGAVHVDDQIVGVQDVMAEDFATKRRVKSASWLGLDFQGRGLGREMRAAALHLAFEGLGATRAVSGYVEGNVASQKVSESLGYAVTGYRDVQIRGRMVRQTELALERSEWETRRRDDIRIDGLEECLDLFGLR